MEAHVAAKDANPKDWVSAVTYGPTFVFGILIQLLAYALAVLHFLATPLIYLGQGIVQLALLPLRILAKFEAFLLFVAGAALTGATVGLLLHFTGSSLSQLLRIAEDPYGRPRKHDPGLVDSKAEDAPYDYRAEWHAMGDHELFSTAIVEEEENSQESG